jgi:hypothetical protein
MSEMAIDGTLNREGVALWLGRRDGVTARVTLVALLRGPGVIKERARLEIAADLFNEVTDVALAHRAFLLGQIHSHGPGWPIDLSPIDHLGGLHMNGFLSVVAPDYGLRLATKISDCGVHVYEQTTGYRRMPSDELNDRIIVVHTAVDVVEVK